MDSGLNITLLQWNIQGFLCHKYALELIVALHKPNIIVLQETHITEGNKHLLHLPGYYTFQHNKDYTYAKSGIAILVKNNINVSHHCVSSGPLLFQYLTIDCGTPLILINIYKEYDVSLNGDMVQHIIFPERGHTLLLGDLNAQNTLWGSADTSQGGLLWEELAEANGLVILNDGSPTLFNTRHTLTSVDVSMSSSDLAPTLSWKTLPMPEVGDHFPILISNDIPTPAKVFVPRFLDVRANWPLFRSKLERFNDDFDESNNINREAAQMKRLFRKAANESIPISRKPREKKKPIWFNSEISRLISTRQRAWRLFRRVRNRENGLCYRRLCALVKRECKKAKRMTWARFLNSLNPFMDVRYLWGKINNLRNSRSDSFSSICLDGHVIAHPKKIADEFASFWSSLSSDVAFDQVVISTKRGLLIEDLSSTANFFPGLTQLVDVSELDETLGTLRGSTPSLDKLTYSMVRNAPFQIKRRLCNLFNNIISSGTFPHDWKLAILSPIPKHGKNPCALEGYRPISLLPVLSKILEKILARRFFRYARGQFLSIQHAFLPHHGTHTLCHRLEVVLRDNLRQRKHSLVLSEDLEKAFDRVVLTNVLIELNSWGVPRQMLFLLKSFLSDRRMLVRIDGYLSRTFPLDNGIPQGSPLSVVLYNIYANSLCRALENSPGIDFVGIFADNIFAVSSGSPEVVENNLDTFNCTIQDWAKSAGAVIPTSKIEVLHVCRKRNCRCDFIRLGQSNTKVDSQLRILGVTFTKNLLWNEHVKLLRSRLGKINNLLRLICSKTKGPHIDTAIDICRSLAIGTISHGITLYGWTSNENVRKLNVAINKCFRTATGLLRPTPVEALRFEGKFSDFRVFLEKFSISLGSKSITLPSHGLHDTFWSHINLRDRNLSSSIDRILGIFSEFDIPLPSKPAANISGEPSILIDDVLSNYKKDSTSAICYRNLLLERISFYQPDMIIYTDGSFDGVLTSFSVVNQLSVDSFITVSETRLPNHSGIFTAELSAVKSAIAYASNERKRTLICTDSLSVTRALRKNRRGIFDNILSSTNSSPIIILWVPSHSGIAGNEFADTVAKNALRLSAVSEIPCFPFTLFGVYKSLRNSIDLDSWHRSDLFLRRVNPAVSRPRYNINLNRVDCIFLARLRVGKTVFNTRHYYENTDPRRCNFCDDFLSVSHILVDCSASALAIPIDKILDCSLQDMLPQIRSALDVHDLRDV